MLVAKHACLASCAVWMTHVGRLKHSGVQADLVTILPSVGLTIIAVTAVFTLPG